MNQWQKDQNQDVSMLTMAKLNIWMGVRCGPAMMVYLLEPFLPIISLSSPLLPLNSMLLSETLSLWSFISCSLSSTFSLVVTKYSTLLLCCSENTYLREGVSSSFMKWAALGQQRTRFFVFCKLVLQETVPKSFTCWELLLQMLNQLRSRLEMIVQAWQYSLLSSRQVSSSQQVLWSLTDLVAFISSFMAGRLSIHSQQVFSMMPLYTCTSKMWTVPQRRGVNISCGMPQQL